MGVVRLMCYSETLIPDYQATRQHIPRERNSEPTILGVFQNEMLRGMCGPVQLVVLCKAVVMR
jgi:hypothetical protein